MTRHRSQDSTGWPRDAAGRLHEEGDDALVTVLETADPTLLPVITSLLDDAGIPYVAQGDRATGMLPLGAFGGELFGRTSVTRVRVPADRAEEATALLEADVPDESP